ncbi:hypothetical protein GCM10027321_28170 [Massilia terrae]
MAAHGADDAGVAQQAHGAADYHRVGAEAERKLVGRHQTIMLRHVEERVENRREPAIAFHVTYDVT